MSKMYSKVYVAILVFELCEFENVVSIQNVSAKGQLKKRQKMSMQLQRNTHIMNNI